MRLFVTIVFCMFFGKLFSQIDTTNSKFLNVGIYVTENASTDGLSINPGFIIAHTKHNLIFSWRIYQNSHYRVDYPYEKNTEYGYNMSYKYNVADFGKRFNFYYLLNFEYYQRHETEFPSYGNSTKDSYSIGVSPGYGIGVRLYKKVYLLQSFDVGLTTIKIQEIYSREGFTGDREYKDYKPIFNVKLGLQYVL